VSAAAPSIRFCIVTPCLNYAGLLDRTLLSVLTQAGDFSLHYHVQDGGSTDGTLERLAFWQAAVADGRLSAACRRLRLTVASVPDRGIYDALNRGFAALPPDGGSDDVMTWINASDLFHPGALETVARFLRAHPDERWVCGRRANIDEADFPFFVEEEMYGYPRRTLAAGLHVGRSFQWIQPEGMMWRRSLWDAAGGMLDDGFRLAADFDLWRRFAAHAGPVVLDRVTGVYRFHANRLSADIGRYHAEVDACLNRLGLAGQGRLVEEEFARLAAAGDPAALHRHGFTARVARFANGDPDGGWEMTHALPDLAPGWRVGMSASPSKCP